jgi:UMF1 family MFS transporter
MASISFHAAADVSTMYPADAVFYVITIVALLTAQQMFDAYLPLLSMAHWRSLAVGRGEEDPGGGRYPLTACFTKKETKTPGGRDGDGDGADAPRGGGSTYDVGESVGRPTLPPSSDDAERGGGSSNAPFDSNTNSIDAKVEATRQSVASELAFATISLGFVSLLFVIVIQAACVIAMSDQTWALRVCVAFAGAWAFALSFLGARSLRPRPAAPFVIPHGTSKTHAFSTLGFRLTQLSVQMIVKHHPQLVRLLLGHTLSVITNATVIANYVVFVQRELNATATDVIIVLFVVTVTSLVSTTTAVPIVRQLRPTPMKWTLFALKALTPIWPLWMFIGMKRRWEIFALPAVAGLVNPCILPMLRGIFQQCIPHGYEAAFFSLVGVCTVGFAWVGSVVFAGVWSATGSPRWGVLAVVIFVAVGLVFVGAFDFDAAQERRKEIEDECDAFAGGAFDSLRSEASKRGRMRRNEGGAASRARLWHP